MLVTKHKNQEVDFCTFAAQWKKKHTKSEPSSPSRSAAPAGCSRERSSSSRRGRVLSLVTILFRQRAADVLRHCLPFFYWAARPLVTRSFARRKRFQHAVCSSWGPARGRSSHARLTKRDFNMPCLVHRAVFGQVSAQPFPPTLTTQRVKGPSVHHLQESIAIKWNQKYLQIFSFIFTARIRKTGVPVGN